MFTNDDIALTAQVEGEVLQEDGVTDRKPGVDIGEYMSLEVEECSGLECEIDLEGKDNGFERPRFGLASVNSRCAKAFPEWHLRCAFPKSQSSEQELGRRDTPLTQYEQGSAHFRW